MTDNAELVDRLTRHRALGGAPREELEWLARHGSMRKLKAGDVLLTKNQPVQNLWVVLSGRIAIFVDRGSGPHR
jgi:signal-transduction protein with cAMP-binding, CBS, and nucleotidyltransferase domain